MAENPTEVAVGAVTLAVAAGFVIYAVQLTGLGQGAGGNYELTASFESAEGVNPGTAVRLAGIRVGTVTEMDLNRETFRADMAFSIDGTLDVPEDSAVAIASEGLLGGTFVEILPGSSPFKLEPGGEFGETQGARSLLGLLADLITGD